MKTMQFWGIVFFALMVLASPLLKMPFVQAAEPSGSACSCEAQTCDIQALPVCQACGAGCQIVSGREESPIWQAREYALQFQINELTLESMDTAPDVPPPRA